MSIARQSFPAFYGGAPSAGPSWQGALSSLGSGLGTANSAMNIYNALQRGGVQGNLRAGIGAGNLASKAGLFGSNTSGVNQGLGAANNLLNIYQGLQRGGLQGYGGAAANAAQLAGSLSGNAALSTAGGYIAAPLAVYNAINNWQSGRTGDDALQGAEAGAAVGSIIPGLGTALGAVIGGGIGALSSAFGNGAVDPENADFEGFTKGFGKYNSQGQGQAYANSVQDPYTVLAGLFDLRGNQITGNIPEYQQYGRMGEQKFVTDMTSQINDALAQGKISKTDTPQAIMSKVVDPWVSSFGKGTMNDPNGQAINDLLTSMVGQYESGNWSKQWKPVGGQDVSDPFGNVKFFGTNETLNQYDQAQNAQQQQQNRALADIRMPMGRGVMKAAKGGSMDPKLRKKLDDIVTGPSFAERKTHFDDGGGVGIYNDYYTSAPATSDPNYSFNGFNPGNVTDFNAIMNDTSGTNPGGSDTTLLQNYLGGDLQSQMTSDQQSTQQQLDLLNALQSGSGGSGNGGLLSALSSLGGTLSQYGKAAAPLASLLPIINALANKGSSPSSPSGQSTGPSTPFPAQTSPRTANAIDPNTDWYTYGQHPEKQFFSNNSIAPLMGNFVGSNSGAIPATGMPTMPAPATPSVQPIPKNAAVMAHGGALDTLADGTPVSGRQSRYVRGAGDGQSDDIDAKLSDGEYVMDAHTVSMLGNGSNEAGARRLDQMRENLRKQAAKPMSKGKQFMKVKPPENYLRGGSKGDR